MKKYIFYFIFSFAFTSVNARNGRNIADTIRPVMEDSVFRKVQLEAAFPGGDKMWRNFLVQNLNAEIPVEKFAPPGFYTVIVQFIVEKNGNITEIRPLTSHGFGMEEEVARVISKGPNWEPAMLDDKPVRAYRRQPVTFMVEAEFKLSTYSISAGKENVIEVIAEGVKPENMEVELSNGNIRHDGGDKYTVTVDKPGRIYLTVWIWIKKKKNELGKVAVEVK